MDVTPTASGSYTFNVQAYTIDRVMGVDNSRDGSINVTKLGDNNFNMPAQFVADKTHWPRSVPNNVPEWRHSDIDNVAYPFIYTVFGQIVSISNQ